ncbi:hypothetical protein KSP39_PZI021757 [Platanthera zijinensis]|uniref:Uncharacterized protein n=1 Tax=Platanthera zijinensis TaxID=2320716 RepID=A0AAP0AYJ7_9ASPA
MLKARILIPYETYFLFLCSSLPPSSKPSPPLPARVLVICLLAVVACLLVVSACFLASVGPARDRKSFLLVSGEIKVNIEQAISEEVNIEHAISEEVNIEHAISEEVNIAQHGCLDPPLDQLESTNSNSKDEVERDEVGQEILVIVGKCFISIDAHMSTLNCLRGKGLLVAVGELNGVAVGELVAVQGRQFVVVFAKPRLSYDCLGRN